MTSQIAATIPNVVADGPLADHGETDVNPNPAPRARSIKDVAAAATAPATIEGHDTAEAWVSSDTKTSAPRSIAVFMLLPNPMSGRMIGMNYSHQSIGLADNGSALERVPAVTFFGKSTQECCCV
jgi:hypothetical protein